MSAINLPGTSLQGPGLPDPLDAAGWRGQVGEHAAAAEFFAGPRDPYSRALIAATGRRRQPTGAPPGEDGI